MYESDDLYYEDEETPPEEASNRTFLIAAGILGGIVLLSLACMAGYAFVILPQQRAVQAGDQNALATQNAQINEAITATGVAFDLSQTPQATETLLPTDTPEFTPTPEPATGTVAAGFTQMAVVTSTESSSWFVVINPAETATEELTQIATSTMAEPPTTTPEPLIGTVAAALTQVAAATQPIIPTSATLPTTGGGGPDIPASGRLETTYPLEMVLGESREITVEIIIDPELVDIGEVQPVFGSGVFSNETNSEDNGRTYIHDRIKLYPIMSAELIATNFDVNSGPATNSREISRDHSAAWTWNISAKKTGTQNISINIYGQMAEGAEISLIKNKSPSIIVVDKPVPQRIFDNLVDNWDTILVTVVGTGGPLGLWLAFLTYRASRSDNELKSRVARLEKRLRKLYKGNPSGEKQ